MALDLSNISIGPVLSDEHGLKIATTNFTNVNGTGFILKLSRFRKIKNITVTFPRTGIVLLDGRSGIGKTTILEAISFVLYDDAGNTCYPRQERASKKKHDSTWVELKFPDGLIIFRQRRPNLLKVEGNGISLCDDSAQAYIDRFFGSLNSWLVGGYLQQLQMCSFFSMSSDDKLKLLQEMSLSDKSSGFVSGPEKFEKLLGKTIERISVLSTQVYEAEMQTRVQAELYLQLYNQCSPNVKAQSTWSFEVLKEHLSKYGLQPVGEVNNQLGSLLLSIRNSYSTKIQTVRTQIANNQIKIAQMKEGLKQRANLNEILNGIGVKLDGIPKDLDEKIKIAERELSELSEQIGLAQKSERRSQLLATKTEIQRKLDLIPDERSNYSLKELDLIDHLLAGPNIEQINKELNEMDLAKEYQLKLGIYQRRQTLLQQIGSLEKQLDNYPKASVSDEIELITKKIWSLTLQQQKLICPKCSANLHLSGGILNEIKCENHETSSLNELNSQKIKYQQQETQFQQKGHLEKSLNNYKEQLIQFDNKELSNIERFDPNAELKYALISSYKLDLEINRLQELKRDLTLLPPNLTSTIEERSKFNNHQERMRLIRDIETISKELNGLDVNDNQPVEIKNLETKRSNLRNSLNGYRSLQNQGVSLMASKEQIINQLNDYPLEDTTQLEEEVNELQVGLEKLTKEIQQWEEDISNQMQLNQLLEMYKRHDVVQKLYQELNSKLASMQKIKATLITAEYIILNSVLTELNRTIGEVLDTLFQEPISVNIRSLKQLKSDDRIKPQINCQIVYEEAECAKVGELSKGEGIRVSLAIAIAFSRFSNIPFLLLDESLSTLDVVTKESSINMIRKYLPDKLVIAVNHDTTVGVYDSIIKLT